MPTMLSSTGRTKHALSIPPGLPAFISVGLLGRNSALRHRLVEPRSTAWMSASDLRRTFARPRRRTARRDATVVRVSRRQRPPSSRRRYRRRSVSTALVVNCGSWSLLMSRVSRDRTTFYASRAARPNPRRRVRERARKRVCAAKSTTFFSRSRERNHREDEEVFHAHILSFSRRVQRRTELRVESQCHRMKEARRANPDLCLVGPILYSIASHIYT